MLSTCCGAGREVGAGDVHDDTALGAGRETTSHQGGEPLLLGSCLYHRYWFITVGGWPWRPSLPHCRHRLLPLPPVLVPHGSRLAWQADIWPNSLPSVDMLYVTDSFVLVMPVGDVGGGVDAAGCRGKRRDGHEPEQAQGTHTYTLPLKVDNGPH